MRKWRQVPITERKTIYQKYVDMCIRTKALRAFSGKVTPDFDYYIGRPGV